MLRAQARDGDQDRRVPPDVVQATHRQAGQPEDGAGLKAHTTAAQGLQLQLAAFENDECVGPVRLIEGAACPGREGDHPALEPRPSMTHCR